MLIMITKSAVNLEMPCERDLQISDDTFYDSKVLISTYCLKMWYAHLKRFFIIYNAYE